MTPSRAWARKALPWHGSTCGVAGQCFMTRAAKRKRRRVTAGGRHRAPAAALPAPSPPAAASVAAASAAKSVPSLRARRTPRCARCHTHRQRPSTHAPCAGPPPPPPPSPPPPSACCGGVRYPPRPHTRPAAQPLQPCPLTRRPPAAAPALATAATAAPRARLRAPLRVRARRRRQEARPTRHVPAPPGPGRRQRPPPPLPGRAGGPCRAPGQRWAAHHRQGQPVAGPVRRHSHLPQERQVRRESGQSFPWRSSLDCLPSRQAAAATPARALCCGRTRTRWRLSSFPLSFPRGLTGRASSARRRRIWAWATRSCATQCISTPTASSCSGCRPRRRRRHRARPARRRLRRTRRARPARPRRRRRRRTLRRRCSILKTQAPQGSRCGCGCGQRRGAGWACGFPRRPRVLLETQGVWLRMDSRRAASPGHRHLAGRRSSTCRCVQARSDALFTRAAAAEHDKCAPLHVLPTCAQRATGLFCAADPWMPEHAVICNVRARGVAELPPGALFRMQKAPSPY